MDPREALLGYSLETTERNLDFNINNTLSEGGEIRHKKSDSWLKI